jgi:hypothetical protein
MNAKELQQFPITEHKMIKRMPLWQSSLIAMIGKELQQQRTEANFTIMGAHIHFNAPTSIGWELNRFTS